MMNTSGLTQQQAKALEFIAGHLLERRLSPSLAEIRDALGYRSKASVHRVLAGLRKRGRVDWQHGCSRSISIVPQSPGAFVLPKDVQAKLDRYCFATNERPEDVVADAVALHLDLCEGPVEQGECEP